MLHILFQLVLKFSLFFLSHSSYPEEEIEAKVGTFRLMLMEKGDDEADGECGVDEHGKST